MVLVEPLGTPVFRAALDEGRGGEGGADASLFADQLTGSITAFLNNSGANVEVLGATSLLVKAERGCL